MTRITMTMMLNVRLISWTASNIYSLCIRLGAKKLRVACTPVGLEFFKALSDHNLGDDVTLRIHDIHSMQHELLENTISDFAR